MTTRSGLIGIMTGLIATIILYPLYYAWQQTDSALYLWIVMILVVILATICGFIAGKWSGSVQPWRSAVLGMLSGGLCGSLIFCLWGAGAAGSVSLFGYATTEILSSYSQVDLISVITRQTTEMFFALFLGGCGLGAAGGWLACRRQRGLIDRFNKEAPQMAMNAAITAVPSSIFAAGLSAGIFTHMANLIHNQIGTDISINVITDFPVAISIFLVLVSQLALTLVIPHEAQQSEHYCGMNEVKMGAYVGMGAFPAFILAFLLINVSLLLKPGMIFAAIISASMSLVSLRTLVKLILPRRSTLPTPVEERQKTEASLFGTIARSHGPRLVALCAGCGLVMMLPLYVTVLSILINISNSPFTSIPGDPWRLFLIQALASSGVIIAAVVSLSVIYLFYLNLGRWFSQWNARRS